MNNTYFTIGDLTFQQISGTAMGAPFSPTIASIYMSVILCRFLLCHTTPLPIQRYIDDIFLIWSDSADNLHKFLQELNSIHPNLHFTHHLSNNSIDFLDPMVRISTLPTYWTQNPSRSSSTCINTCTTRPTTQRKPSRQ